MINFFKGFPNIPITTTTRRTLLKKLKNYMEDANIKLKNGSSSPSSLTKFSSDEESIDYRKKSRHKKESVVKGQESKAKTSGKNIFISPVFVSDSVDFDASNKSTVRPIFHQQQQQGSNKDSNIITHKTNDYSYEINDVSNASSIYTKRLLQLRKNNIQNLHHTRSTMNQQEEYKSVKGKNENAYFQNFKRNIRKLVEKVATAKQTFVPMFLIAILIIFFAFIIIMYMNMSPNIEKSLQQSIVYVPCDDGVSHGSECIDESQIETLLKTLKIIGLELQKRSEKLDCNQKSKAKTIWCIDGNESIEGKSDIFPDSMTNNLIDVQYLIDKNAFLGINNVDSFGSLIDFQRNVNSVEHCFALSSQGVPLYCSFYAKVHKYFAIIGTLTTLLIIILASRKVYSFLMQAREKRDRQINQIVEDILSYVLESTMDDEEDDDTGKYIIVNEMKDKLLMLSKNIELSWAWNEALKYLEKHDRRIHFGFENVKGEDVKIIRMIPTVRNNIVEEKKGTSNQQFQPKNQPQESSKKWMGPAFDKSNKIKDPPTSCLKIRQMFDKYEVNNPNLLAIIRDTILLKVSDKCKIYDIQLDKKTCCVYVKCKSCIDAGIIHEEMNGWWLDQRLLIVKFLREDKFHQRFPNSSFKA